MTKPILALFLKSHVDTFTRKDGVVVQAHETKVQKQPHEMTESEHLVHEAGKSEAWAQKQHDFKKEGYGDSWTNRDRAHPSDRKEMQRVEADLFNAQMDHVTLKNGGELPVSTKAHRDRKDELTARSKRNHGYAIKQHAKENPPPAKDWRDEENWHTRTMMKFETLPDASLKYIIKDATEAADIAEQRDPNSKKAGQYRDECHYAHMELHKRRHSGSPMVRAAQAMQDHHATMRAEKAEIDRAAKG